MEMWRMSLQIMQKNFNQILGLLIRNMISKKCEFALFYYIFLKKLKMTSPTKKLQNNYWKCF